MIDIPVSGFIEIAVVKGYRENKRLSFQNKSIRI
jgi:hypothetical protein